MKRLAYSLTILFMYMIAFSPLLLHGYCPIIFKHIRLCMIFEYVIGITAICFIISLFAMVLKAYKTAFLFALVPLFVESVVLCSALLIFMFHKELTAAMVVGKIRTVGSGVFKVLQAPFAILPGK